MQIKEIANSHGYYFISDTGEIYSKKNSRWGGYSQRLKKLRPWIRIDSRSGYKSILIQLSIPFQAVKTFIVARLVLETFISPCPNGMEACHNDENSLNNILSNLRWDTHPNNMRGAYFDGKRQDDDLDWVILHKRYINKQISLERAAIEMKTSKKVVGEIFGGRRRKHLMLTVK